jgi:N-ethylmaleimide reductase
MSASLFQPVRLGDLALANRIVMAPMTRNRADEHGVVPALTREYYRQRASAGLLVTESVHISPQAVGYPFTPGLYDDAQAASWLRVTNAVHSAGGRIFVQLQHCGRISHPSLQPESGLPVAPSALPPAGRAVTYEGLEDFVSPRALDVAEIGAIVSDYGHAAELARRAGFDGVEVHAGNGYLVDQFLRDGSNERGDAYGGSVENRMRFLSEVIDAVCSVWPVLRVGVRITPENSFNSMFDSAPQDLAEHVAGRLTSRGLAYLHVLEGDMWNTEGALDYQAVRARFGGLYIANNGYVRDRAEASLKCGAADLVAFGRAFIANPDLVRRYRDDLALNAPDASTFYTGGEVGYVDYPFHRVYEAEAA